ncbi:MAG: hypothetical protein LBD92_00140 [Oscillospiraceae bacterium]|jgi:hypothetical protein|nr:hypothetical protein [Oscillospiraceae bacterium]
MKIKKLISILLVVSLLCTMSSAAFAADGTPPSRSDGVIVTNTVAATVLSADEAAQYDVFNVQLPVTDSEDGNPTSYIDTILALCEFDSVLQAGDIAFAIYKSDTLPAHLNDCEKIIEISAHDEFLYITYTTNSGAWVTLCYTHSGLRDRGVYFEDADTGVYTSNDITVKEVKGAVTGVSTAPFFGCTASAELHNNGSGVKSESDDDRVDFFRQMIQKTQRILCVFARLFVKYDGIKRRSAAGETFDTRTNNVA